MTKKERRILFWIVPGFLGISFLLLNVPIAIHYFSNFTPEQAMRHFKTRVCAEDQIIYPLMVCGKKAVPFIIEEIKNPNMTNRGYAILALGHIGDHSAKNALLEIIGSPNEKHFIRYDALRALILIDSSVARGVAQKFVGKDIGYLSELSEKLVKDELERDYFEKRTYMDALFDRHL